MKSRALVMLATATVLGLFTFPVFAQKPEKAKVEHKCPGIAVASCNLYSKGAYLTGKFKGYEEQGSDWFTRKVLGVGMGCKYEAPSKFSLGMGAEFYFGDFNIKHEENGFKGSFSYPETGLKAWVRSVFISRNVTIGLGAGVQKTGSRRFKVNSLQTEFGGSWFDFSQFASEHLIGRVDLEVWEAGFDVSFPFRRNLSFTVGALWQRYNLAAHIEWDKEATELLKDLHFNKNIERDYHPSVDFFYLTPGAEWCGKRLCASLVVPWGAFVSEAWSWGSTLEVKFKF